MMNPQVMRDIVDEIVQGKLPVVVQTAAALWKATHLEYVRSSANHIFRARIVDQPVYLRLTPASQRRRSAIEAELDLVRLVAQTGLQVAEPIALPSGDLVAEVPGGHTTYVAVMFVGLQGTQKEAEEFDLARCWACGQTLARLHQATRAITQPLARPHWQADIEALSGQLPADDRALAAFLTAEAAWVASQPAIEQGVLHGDFEADNLVWNGTQCAVLDFDGAAYGWYALDVAIAVADWWWDARTVDDPRLQQFAAGYRQSSPLPAEWLEHLPRLQRLLVAVKVGHLIAAYAATPPDADPAWLAVMRRRHATWLESKRALLNLDL